MLVNIFGAKCIGIDAVRVTVEINIDRGIGIHLCGLADVAVKESLLRTTTALCSLGFRIPGKKIVINLAPADLHKNGSGYDLPIALGILAASEQLCFPDMERFLIMGELGLDGSLRDIPGALPIAELAAKEGFFGCILPTGSALEAIEVEGVRLYGAGNLSDVIRILCHRQECDSLLATGNSSARKTDRDNDDIPDFADIIGQEGAKRGIEIAAAGNHNAILIGSPGSGKSSLAKAMTGILPPMSKEESLVTSKIYSVSSKGGQRIGLIRKRPFRAPHYSASLPAIIGGGGDPIIPGEVSLAQNGILFLDEIGQMPKSVIEALRGPLEDRKVCVSRLRSKIELPASFTLVAASNPCPCGYWGDGDRCNCSQGQRLRYLSRLSGPLMDRIDIQLWLRRVTPSELLSNGKAESSEIIASRVRKAREIQTARFEGENIFTNAEMNTRQIEKYCPLDKDCSDTLSDIMEKTDISMRAYYRIIRVARTIADLAGAINIEPDHLLEAASYRFLDRMPE